MRCRFRASLESRPAVVQRMDEGKMAFGGLTERRFGIEQEARYNAPAAWAQYSRDLAKIMLYCRRLVVLEH